MLFRNDSHKNSKNSKKTKLMSLRVPKINARLQNSYPLEQLFIATSKSH